MYCFSIPNRAKASERQRTSIGKIYHMLTCTRNDVFDVLSFYIQPGQSQRTPATDDWKNISHANMHLKRRLRCIVFLHSTGPKPVNASDRRLENNITCKHALETTSSMYCVFIFNRAKASERQQPLIGNTNHMQTCTRNDVAALLGLYIQPGQSQ